MLPSEIIIYFVAIILHTMLYIFFIVGPFQSRLRFPMKKILIIVTGYMLITIWLFWIGFDASNLIPMFRPATLVIWLVFTVASCFVCIKTNPLELLFSIFIIFNIQANVIVGARALRYIFLLPNPPSWAFDGDKHIFNTIILFVFYAPFMWYLFMHLLKRVVDLKIEFRNWRFFWVIPLLFYLNLYVSKFSGIGASGTYSYRDLLVLVLLNIVEYSSYVICLQMLIKTYESLIASQHVYIMKKQLEIQKTQYRKLTETIEKTARLRHDWRHHLLVVADYVKTQNYEMLEEYLGNYLSSQITDYDLPICGHATVNAVLRHFIALAMEQEIKVSYDVTVPDDLTIPDIDLCVVFGNLLENAIEACEKQTEGDRFVSIKATVRGNQLCVRIQNSFGELPKQKGDIFYSTKHEGEGMGISSVKIIAESRNGNFMVHMENGVFQVDVVI